MGRLKYSEYSESKVKAALFQNSLLIEALSNSTCQVILIQITTGAHHLEAVGFTILLISCFNHIQMVSAQATPKINMGSALYFNVKMLYPLTEQSPR